MTEEDQEERRPGKGRVDEERDGNVPAGAEEPPRETTAQGAAPPDRQADSAGRGTGGDPGAAPQPGTAEPGSHETEDERLLQSEAREPGALPHPVLDRDAWRVFRIMGEFVTGFEELATLGPAVSVFGSARSTPDEEIYERCVETARLLGEHGFSIITGGGPGLMEAANKGAREAGVTSVGCNIELPFEQATNAFVDQVINFRYFFVRKTMFVKYATGFVIFPGGYGTMDELFEALTLIQTGKVRDFPVVLFGTGYWKGLVEWMDRHVLGAGRISPEDLDLFMLTDSPREAADFILTRNREHRRKLTHHGESRP